MFTHKKSLGKLRKARKTKTRSPDLVGEISLQRDDIAAIAKYLNESDLEEVVCNLAVWSNRGPFGSFLTVQLSPPYVPQDHQPQGTDSLDFIFGDPEEV